MSKEKRRWISLHPFDLLRYSAIGSFTGAGVVAMFNLPPVIVCWLVVTAGVCAVTGLGWTIIGLLREQINKKASI